MESLDLSLPVKFGLDNASIREIVTITAGEIILGEEEFGELASLACCESIEVECQDPGIALVHALETSLYGSAPDGIWRETRNESLTCRDVLDHPVLCEQ